ncbi:hypothetical protein [Streptomyces sp. NPDC002156]
MLASWYDEQGTAADVLHVGELPDHQAVPLPDHLSYELGASLGIPGSTAHRTVFADGPVDGKLVLVHGVLGGVRSLAAQLACWGGAIVLATVRRSSDLDRVDPAVVSHAIALDQEDPAAAIRAYAPQGVDRIIEAALSDNAVAERPVHSEASSTTVMSDGAPTRTGGPQAPAPRLAYSWVSP